MGHKKTRWNQPSLVFFIPPQCFPFSDDSDVGDGWWTFTWTTCTIPSPMKQVVRQAQQLSLFTMSAKGLNVERVSCGGYYSSRGAATNCRASSYTHRIYIKRAAIPCNIQPSPRRCMHPCCWSVAGQLLVSCLWAFLIYKSQRSSTVGQGVRHGQELTYAVLPSWFLLSRAPSAFCLIICF